WQIATLRQRIDDWNARLGRDQRKQIALLRERLESREAALNAANPQAILARGYAIVSQNGQRIKSAGEAHPGDGHTIQLHDGEIKARIEYNATHELYSRPIFGSGSCRSRTDYCAVAAG